MQEFKKGQQVHVEYNGTVESVHGNVLSVRKDVGGMGLVGTSKMKVTLLDPAGWPPQVGDIWEIEGDEYFARQSVGGRIVMIPAAGLDPWELDRFKAFNPVLVRRRGQ